MLLLALLACEASTGSTAISRGPDAAELGSEAPDLPLVGPDGAEFFLGESRGKVIFLDMSAFH